VHQEMVRHAGLGFDGHCRGVAACAADGDSLDTEALVMETRRVSTRESLIQHLLSKIDHAVQGQTDGEGRRRAIDELSRSLRSMPTKFQQAVGPAVDRAIAAGTITEDEGQCLTVPP